MKMCMLPQRRDGNSGKRNGPSENLGRMRTLTAWDAHMEADDAGRPGNYHSSSPGHEIDQTRKYGESSSTKVMLSNMKSVCYGWNTSHFFVLDQNELYYALPSLCHPFQVLSTRGALSISGAG